MPKASFSSLLFHTSVLLAATDIYFFFFFKSFEEFQGRVIDQISKNHSKDGANHSFIDFLKTVYLNVKWHLKDKWGRAANRLQTIHFQGHAVI